MKTVFLFILLFAGIICKSDTVRFRNSDDIIAMNIPVNEDGVINNANEDLQYSFIKAVKAFISFTNWLFVVVFMILAWLINDTSAGTNTAKWMTWFNSLPKTLRSMGIGVLLALLFYWGFDFHTKKEVMSLIFSILVTMVIYKIGIDKVLRFISKTFLKIKFNEKEKI